MPNLTGLAALFRLRPDRAADYLAAKGFRLSGPYWEMDGPQHSHLFTVANLAKMDVLHDIRAAVQQALDEGLTEKWFGDQLVDVLKRKGWWGGKDGSLRRLHTIYATNLQTALMAGRHRQAMEQIDRAPWAQYMAIRDHRSRPAHAAMHGQVFRIDSPAWACIAPPSGYNCFPAETIVSGLMELGLKTWYSGQMVEMETITGKRLTVTANHPILTRSGWLRADQIDETDSLLSHASGIDASASGIVDHEDTPTRADDCFNALAVHGMRVVDIAPFDFDGDAINRKGHIHVAGANGVLLDRAISGSAQGVENRQFVGAGDGSSWSLVGVTSSLFDSGTAQPMLAHDAPDIAMGLPVFGSHGATGDEGVLVASQDICFQSVILGRASLPCGAELSCDTFGSGLDVLPLDALGFTAPPAGNAIDPQHPHNCGPATSVLFGQLVDAFPSLITIEQIRHVRKFEWSGHVFDFETKTGLIVANGLIVHNCRCSARYLSDRELEKRGLKPAEDIQILEREPPGKIPVNPRTGATPQRWIQRGVSVPSKTKPGERDILWADPGWDNIPGSDGAERMLVDRLMAKATDLGDGVRMAVQAALRRQGVRVAGPEIPAAAKVDPRKPPTARLRQALALESERGHAAVRDWLDGGRVGPRPSTEDARRAMAEAYIRQRETRTPSRVLQHGMTTPEQHLRFEWEGLRFSYEEGNRAAVVSSVVAIADRAPIPRRLLKHAREVHFTAQRNKDDALWAQRYGMPNFKSHATGGDGHTVVYNGSRIDADSLAHEMGHSLASVKYGGTTAPLPTSDFAKAAASGEAPPTAYAAKSPAEDFAESVYLYVVTKWKLRTTAPQRYRVIDRLMKEDGYDG